jgi:hypothetical protein
MDAPRIDPRGHHAHEGPSLQLDRVPLRLVPPQETGTHSVPAGVWQGVEPGPAQAEARVRQIGRLAWVLIAFATFSLLGQGERCRVDRRFRTPSATLGTYWEAMRANDEEAIGECMLDGPQDQPFAGMLWFMPPTTEVHLEEFHSLPVTGGRVMVSYQVRFRPTGARDDQVFQTGNELVRTHGAWRIARGLGNASMPEWKSIPRPVDI